jgi:Thrombospondin type 1 domain
MAKSFGCVQTKASQPQFSHLRRGYVWFDPATMMMVTARSTSECLPSGSQSTSVPSWQYSISDFYGYRGEKPFYAHFERADYSGYQQLRCLTLRMQFQADPPGHLPPGWLRLVSTVASPDVPQVAALRVQIPGSAGDLIAAVWRDNANRTFVPDGTIAASVPLPRLLQQSASGETCTLKCWQAVTVKIATSTGQQGLAVVEVTRSSVLSGYSAIVRYKSYVVGDVQQSTSTITLPPLQLSGLQRSGISAVGSRAGATRVNLETLSTPILLSAANFLNPASIDRQWTISTKIVVPLAQLAGWEGKVLLAREVQVDGKWVQWPAVSLSETASGAVALTVKFDDTIQRHVIDPYLNSLSSGLHLQLTSDNGSLSIWLDGAMVVAPISTPCLQSPATQKTCRGTTLPSSMKALFGHLIVGPDPVPGCQLDHVRLYNYALPRTDITSGEETMCTYYGDCSLFGIVGWTPSDPVQPVPSNPFVPPRLRYVAGNWGPCTKDCGQGAQQRAVDCVRTDAGGSSTVVASSNCQAGLDTPATSRSCNVQACLNAAVERDTSGEILSVNSLGTLLSPG